jgi:CelD/BcsL family acetyltransferase involved in cellulose biosynthesis
MSFKIKIFNEFNEDLEKIWKNFEKESSNYCFQNYYWLKNWHINLKNKNKLFTTLVYKNNTLIMILPLYVEKKYGIKILKWQGGEQADYMNMLILKDFVINNDDFLNLWKLIKKEISFFDLLYFEKQQKFIGEILNPLVQNLNVEKNYVSHSISLPNSLDLFIEKNLKNKFIRDTERMKKNLQKEGDIEFLIYENNDNSKKQEIIKEIINQKILRIKELKQKNVLDKDTQNFYLKFDDSEFSNGKLHISSLNLNGKSLAAHWGVVYKNVFYYLMPTIAKTDFMKHAPGRLLLFFLIEWSIKNKIKKFDLTIGDESYKKNWSNSKIDLFSYLERKNLKSYPIYFYFKFKNKIKNLVKKFLS